MAKLPDCTIVIACFNESEHLENSVKRLISVLNTFSYKYELIFIDDKSLDKTKRILKNIENNYQNQNFHFFYHEKNIGRGGTISEGIERATAPIVGFIDIDLEVSPEYISSFIEAIHKKQADVAIARRNYAFRFWPLNYLIREILSRGYVVFTRLLLGHPFHDTEAGYKFFKREAILPVLKKTQDKHWFWDTEVVVRSYFHGLTIKEIPVVFLRRKDKTSTVKIIPDTLSFLKAVQKFRITLENQYGRAPGLLYRSPMAYRLAMEKIFGPSYKLRYTPIAQLIPNGSTVLDVCCGDAVLFSYLHKKNISYHGFDISLPFVRSNLKRGIKITLGNLEQDPLSPADYVVMQGSLFQFKNPQKIVEKLLLYAKNGVIISESVQNLKESSYFNPLAHLVMPLIVSTHHDAHFRFSNDTFKKVLAPFHPDYLSIEGGRDTIAFIKK